MSARFNQEVSNRHQRLAALLLTEVVVEVVRYSIIFMLSSKLVVLLREVVSTLKLESPYAP